MYCTHKPYKCSSPSLPLTEKELTAGFTNRGNCNEWFFISFTHSTSLPRSLGGVSKHGGNFKICTRDRSRSAPAWWGAGFVTDPCLLTVRVFRNREIWFKSFILPIALSDVILSTWGYIWNMINISLCLKLVLEYVLGKEQNQINFGLVESNKISTRHFKATLKPPPANADGCQNALRCSSLNRHGRGEFITVISPSIAADLRP